MWVVFKPGGLRERFNVMCVCFQDRMGWSDGLRRGGGLVTKVWCTLNVCLSSLSGHFQMWSKNSQFTTKTSQRKPQLNKEQLNSHVLVKKNKNWLLNNTFYIVFMSTPYTHLKEYWHWHTLHVLFFFFLSVNCY